LLVFSFWGKVGKGAKPSFQYLSPRANFARGLRINRHPERSEGSPPFNWGVKRPLSTLPKTEEMSHSVRHDRINQERRRFLGLKPSELHGKNIKRRRSLTLLKMTINGGGGQTLIQLPRENIKKEEIPHCVRNDGKNIKRRRFLGLKP